MWCREAFELIGSWKDAEAEREALQRLATVVLLRPQTLNPAVALSLSLSISAPDLPTLKPRGAGGRGMGLGFGVEGLGKLLKVQGGLKAFDA